MEDFIPVYPEVDSIDIQKQVASRKEFVEMASILREPVPVRGELYLNQKLFVRLATRYDRILNISETGVGKSRQIIGLREHLKKTNSHIKRCIVLQKPATISQFKAQIVYGCPDNEYETDLIRNADNDRSKRSNISTSVGRWYSIMTYPGFFNEIQNGTFTDEQIIEYYSDTMFVLDEAHMIRNEGDSGSAKSVGRMYKAIKRILHVAKRIKVIVSTATPLINGVGDLGKIANLVLPADMQIPESWDFSKMTLAQLERFLRGKVFYMRALDTGAVRNYMGNKILKSDGTPYTYTISYPVEESQTEILDPKNVTEKTKQPQVDMEIKEVESNLYIELLVMSGIQDETYNSLQGIEDLDNIDVNSQNSTNIEVDSDDVGKSLYIQPRQASCFVFPDGSYGNAPKNQGGNWGFSKYVITDSSGNYKATPELAEHISDMNKLKNLSIKYHNIVGTEASSPGVGYIYNEFVSGSGAIVLGLCMEHQTCTVKYSGEKDKNGNYLPSPLHGKKFTRFMSGNSIFTTNAKGDRVANFPKAPRYALITGKIPDNVRASILEVMESPENIDGEYIKFIIVSQIGRDGINIFHALRSGLVTPGWHNAGMYQGLSRVMRTTSHNDLIQREMRHRNIVNPMEITIPVKEYKFAASSSNPRIKSVDLAIYQYAEKKSIQSHYYLRMLKQIDIGCEINRVRNIVGPEHNFTEICDYKECDYPSAFDAINSPDGVRRPIPDIDYSTYDIMYSDEIVNSCICSIVRVLQQVDSVSYEVLRKEWVETGIYRENFIYMAIDKLVNSKSTMKDRFGFVRYVVTDGISIYSQREYPINNHINNNYGNYLVGIDHTNLTTQSEIQGSSLNTTLIESIKEHTDYVTNQGKLTFESYINTLDRKVLVDFIETSFQQWIHGDRSDYIVALLNRYSVYLCICREPSDDIKVLKDKYERGEITDTNAKTMTKNGKTCINIDYVGSTKFDSNGKENRVMYAHFLQSINTPSNQSYDIVPRFRNVRSSISIYDPKKDKNFIVVGDAERIAYSNIFQERTNDKFIKYAKNEFLGTILCDNKFRIQTSESVKSLYDDDNNIVKEDLRHNFRGKSCESWKKPDLIRILGSNLYTTPEVKRIPINISEEDITKSLVKVLDGIDHTSFTQDQLNNIYRWSIFKPQTSIMCRILKEQMYLNNEILTEGFISLDNNLLISEIRLNTYIS